MKLARTGIEQPYMRDRPRFIEVHRDFERVANVNVSKLCDFMFSSSIEKAKCFGNCLISRKTLIRVLQLTDFQKSNSS